MENSSLNRRESVESQKKLAPYGTCRSWSRSAGCVAMDSHYKDGNVLDECPFRPYLPFETLLTHVEALDS